MNKPRHKKISKFLSFVLRDHPDGIGIELDSGGWADVSDLLRAAEHNDFRITLDELTTIAE